MVGSMRTLTDWQTDWQCWFRRNSRRVLIQMENIPPSCAHGTYRHLSSYECQTPWRVDHENLWESNCHSCSTGDPLLSTCDRESSQDLHLKGVYIVSHFDQALASFLASSVKEYLNKYIDIKPLGVCDHHDWFATEQTCSDTAWQAPIWVYTHENLGYLKP